MNRTVIYCAVFLCSATLCVSLDSWNPAENEIGTGELTGRLSEEHNSHDDQIKLSKKDEIQSTVDNQANGIATTDKISDSASSATSTIHDGHKPETVSKAPHKINAIAPSITENFVDNVHIPERTLYPETIHDSASTTTSTIHDVHNPETISKTPDKINASTPTITENFIDKLHSLEKTINGKSNNGGSSTESNQKDWSGDCKKCKIQNANITNFRYISNASDIHLSWDPDGETLEHCKTEYSISTDIANVPYERRRVAGNRHTIRMLLDVCQSYPLTIKSDKCNEFTYTLVTVLMTEPEKIRDLKTSLIGDTIRLSWAPAVSPQCSKYRVTFNDASHDTNNTFYEINHPADCGSISVQTVRNDSVLGVKTIVSVPGPVINPQILPIQDQAFLNWKPPERSNCVIAYKVIINGTLLEDIREVTNLNLTAHLHWCSGYSIKIAAASQTSVGKYEELSSILKPESIIASVQNVIADYYEPLQEMNIRWSAPKHFERCITGYWVDGFGTDNYTKESSLVIKNAIPCKVLTGNITARSSVGTSTERIELKVNGSVPTPPKCKLMNRINKTEVSLSCTVQPQSENMCPMRNLEAYCNATEKPRASWVKSIVNYMHNIPDISTSSTVGVNIKNLSEYTNYTCYFAAINTFGPSELSEKIVFRTLVAAPSKPVNFAISGQDASSVSFKWERPTKIPGGSFNYRFSIRPTISYFIPDYCELTPSTYDLNSNSLEYTYNEIHPHVNYSFGLRANIGNENGDEAIITFTSGTDIPDPPRNMSHRIIDSTGDEYNAAVILSWQYPCNPNGQVKYFNIFITSDCDSRNETVPVNDPLANAGYSMEHRFVKALCNYEVRAETVVNDELRSEPATLNFESPEAVPSAPRNIAATDTDPHSFQVSWEEPEHPNGIIIDYEIKITPLGSVHKPASDCTINLPERKVDTVSALTYQYTEARPNHRYDIRVKAYTKVGGGSEGMAVHQTKEAQSEAVRNLNVELINTDELVNYNVQCKVTFEAPCNTNGELKYYEVTLSGKAIHGEGGDTNSSSDKKLLYYFQLIPEYEYTVSVVAFNGVGFGEPTNSLLFSPAGYPGPPKSVETVAISPTSFEIKWEEPEITNGMIKRYEIRIYDNGPSYEIPESCKPRDSPDNILPVDGTEHQTIFDKALPNYYYNISVLAVTEAGPGNSIEDKHTTSASPSEPVQNLVAVVESNQSEAIYESKVKISFEPPCDINGEFHHFNVMLVGEKNGEEYDRHTREGTITDLFYTFELKPECNYTVTVTLVNSCCESGIETKYFSSPSGVPPFVGEPFAVNETKETTAKITIRQNGTSNENGEVFYYAVLVHNSSYDASSGFGCWDGIWPKMGRWSDDFLNSYQATPERWNPFLKSAGDQEFIYVLGEQNCTGVDSYCNGPLFRNTEYSVQLRVYTMDAYADSNAETFRTLEDFDKAMEVWKIVMICLGIMAFIVLVGILGVIVWEKRKPEQRMQILEDPISDIQYPMLIPIKEFPRYYRDFKENDVLVKNEFGRLNSVSKDLEEELTMEVANNSENKKKNRYINILPYDDTRVILDGVNEYINASYIKGYSDKIEYIATQGPLESTTEDFWQMILDDDIKLIVMVAQFVEQKKEKCYHYFPEIREQIELDNDIQLRCATELNFDYYCERHITVQYNNVKRTVIHLQFLNWPDFGCPKGTANMLNFCLIMRRFMEEHNTKAIVHCSAGVGRTGTLIAVDILLQTINFGGDVDVFSTVLSLRKQRRMMVQTEGQYLYIHSCINDAILDPPVLKEIKAIGNPIYENVNVNSNGIELAVIKSYDDSSIHED